jgi:membrane-associated phospholipid phosphatase
MRMSKINMPGESSADSGFLLWRRFAALWPLKLGVTAVASVLFWSFYLFLSRHPLLPVHTLPLTWLDTWAGYRPGPWAWAYESIFLLTGIAPWLIVSREELRRYIVGFVLLSTVSFVVFALFPVASPRPRDLQSSAFLIFITRVDGPLNAFPSLHAACLIYALALIRHLFGPRLGPMVAILLLVWAGLILFGTLATKQHYAIDLLAGGLLGCAADWVAWRTSAGGDSASMNARLNKEATSQAG